MASCCTSGVSVEEASIRRKLCALILLCCMGLGFMTILESPRSIQTILQKEMSIKPNQFEMHYYFLYWPNVLSCCSWFIIDSYLDLRIVSTIFAILMLLGNTLYAMGAVTRIYLVMLIGWLFTGLGAESSFICIHCYIFRWFPIKYTNTVFAMVKSLSLLGSLLAFEITDFLMKMLTSVLRKHPAFSVTISLTMSVILIPLACGVTLAVMSKMKDNGNSIQRELSFKISNIWQLPLSYWVLTATVNIFLGSCFIFLRLNALSLKYGLNQKQTDVLVSSFSVGAVIMAPIFGLLADWKGRNLTFMTLAFVGGSIAHFAFAFTITDPFYPMILLSASFSLVIGSYWPLYKLICSKKELNAALAIDNSVLMLFCAIGQGVAPRLISHNKTAVEIYYLGSMFFAVVGSCVLWGLDCKLNIFNLTKIKGDRRNKNMSGKRNTNKVDTKMKYFLAPPHRFITPKKREVIKPPKPERENSYLRLKKYEAEGNMYKHQRIKRHSNRMTDRRKKLSTVSEESGHMAQQLSGKVIGSSQSKGGHSAVEVHKTNPLSHLHSLHLFGDHLPPSSISLSSIRQVWFEPEEN